MTAHYVYRCYDDAARLLYVGATKDAPARFAQHRSRSFWTRRVVHVRVLVYRSKEIALLQERTAIRNESPLFNNVKHSNRHGWTERDYCDYIEFLVGEKYAYTYGAKALLELFTGYECVFGKSHPAADGFAERSERERRLDHERTQARRAEEDRRVEELRRADEEDMRQHEKVCCACRFDVVIDDEIVAKYGNGKSTGLMPR